MAPEPLSEPTPTGALRRSITALAARLRAEGPKGAGISRGKASVLANLRVQGPMTPGALATAERVQPQTLTRVLSGLQRDGLIRRTRDPQDGRRQHIEITASGRRVLARDVGARDAWLERAAQDELSPGERDLVLAAAEPLARLAASGSGADGPPAEARAARPVNTFRAATIAPILPTHDLLLTFEFLRSIGFETDRYDDEDEYGFARRGPVDLHYARDDDHDPFTEAGMAYLYVMDADALHEELLQVPGLPTMDSFGEGHRAEQALRERWERERTVARIGAIADQPWLCREFALFDPAGNLFRIGHLLPAAEG